jgi:hypothetical protein
LYGNKVNNIAYAQQPQNVPQQNLNQSNVGVYENLGGFVPNKVVAENP